MLKKEPWMEDDNEAMRIFRQWLHFRSLAWYKAREERVVKRFVTLVTKKLQFDKFMFMISHFQMQVREIFHPLMI